VRAAEREISYEEAEAWLRSHVKHPAFFKQLGLRAVKPEPL